MMASNVEFGFFIFYNFSLKKSQESKLENYGH